MFSLPIVPEVQYAALDSYASILLYCHIIAHVDPVVTLKPPDVGELTPGTALHLYTRANSRAVAERMIVNHDWGDTWGKTSMRVGRDNIKERVVLKVTKIVVPGALTMHPSEFGGQSQSLGEAQLSSNVLWNTVRVWNRI